MAGVAYIIVGHFMGLLLLATMENKQTFKKIWPQTKFGRFIWLELLSFGWVIVGITWLLIIVSLAAYRFCKNLLYTEGKRFLKYGTTTVSNEHEL
ncbi:MAG: hypothetical protein A2Y82_00435 [Candidatus Buchananbacteria bacterium RBG_13_36_9]|uniref:Uncharacterized protein n=1 Tax=Candidatus Buchananbacteria bacterium RBG_13_36_9 TaxID=1797530 RepID=A0A1G1XQ12_9BACT|nr:MAG: hypothetical protein A2Y82_00435 [Candidatus Buchananbacteria bacterium RBG_13_36_9]